MSEQVECLIAIYKDGRALSTAVIGPHNAHIEAAAEWVLQDDLREIVRAPVEVARMFLFEQWPGLEAAVAAVRTEARAA